jgi:hypothetical protein
MKQWSLITRWIRAAGLPTDSPEAHNIQRELEAIADRRQSDTAGPAARAA